MARGGSRTTSQLPYVQGRPSRRRWQGKKPTAERLGRTENATSLLDVTSGRRAGNPSLEDRGDLRGSWLGSKQSKAARKTHPNTGRRGSRRRGSRAEHSDEESEKVGEELGQSRRTRLEMAREARPEVPEAGWQAARKRRARARAAASWPAWTSSNRQEDAPGLAAA